MYTSGSFMLMYDTNETNTVNQSQINKKYINAIKNDLKRQFKWCKQTIKHLMMWKVSFGRPAKQGGRQEACTG